MMGKEVETLPDVELERGAGKPHVLPFRRGREIRHLVHARLGDGYLRDAFHRLFPDIFGHSGKSPEIRADRSNLAVDAGHDQLDPVLREDPRVLNREGVNARGLSQEIIPEPCAVAVLDLSFISQTLVLPALPSLLCPGADYVGLVKPQFECGRAALGSGGIVRDRRQHLAALRQVTAALDAVGFGAASVLKSPVTGGDGNTEFLIRATLGGIRTLTERDLEEVVHA